MNDLTSTYIPTEFGGIPIGKLISFAKLERETGIARSTLRSRLKNGWSVEKAASTPARRYRRAQIRSLDDNATYDVVLTAIGNNKIAVIKAVRALTGLGLRESKDLVEAAPKPVKEGVTKAEAERFSAELRSIGAEAAIHVESVVEDEEAVQ